MGSFKSRYRVDEVPWYWRAPMHVYGLLLGGAMFLYGALVALSSNVKYVGHGLESDKNYIYCFWHQQVFAFNCLAVRFPKLSFFVHPAWYMIPTHYCVRLKGARHLVLGSSGNRGRAAADELVIYLKQGDSTYFTPDGPFGPPGTVQKGALHIAMQSETPVVGIHIQMSRSIRLSGWDRKQIPLPFSDIVVTVATPFIPDAESLDDASRQLAQDMSRAAA